MGRRSKALKAFFIGCLRGKATEEDGNEQQSADRRVAQWAQELKPTQTTTGVCAAGQSQPGSESSEPEKIPLTRDKKMGTTLPWALNFEDAICGGPLTAMPKLKGQASQTSQQPGNVTCKPVEQVIQESQQAGTAPPSKQIISDLPIGHAQQKLDATFSKMRMSQVGTPDGEDDRASLWHAVAAALEVPESWDDIFGTVYHYMFTLAQRGLLGALPGHKHMGPVGVLAQLVQDPKRSRVGCDIHLGVLSTLLQTPILEVSVRKPTTTSMFRCRLFAPFQGWPECQAMQQFMMPIMPPVIILIKTGSVKERNVRFEIVRPLHGSRQLFNVLISKVAEDIWAATNKPEPFWTAVSQHRQSVKKLDDAAPPVPVQPECQPDHVTFKSRTVRKVLGPTGMRCISATVGSTVVADYRHKGLILQALQGQWHDGQLEKAWKEAVKYCEQGSMRCSGPRLPTVPERDRAMTAWVAQYQPPHMDELEIMKQVMLLSRWESGVPPKPSPHPPPPTSPTQSLHVSSATQSPQPPSPTQSSGALRVTTKAALGKALTQVLGKALGKASRLMGQGSQQALGKASVSDPSPTQALHPSLPTSPMQPIHSPSSPSSPPTSPTQSLHSLASAPQPSQALSLTQSPHVSSPTQCPEASLAPASQQACGKTSVSHALIHRGMRKMVELHLELQVELQKWNMHLSRVSQQLRSMASPVAVHSQAQAPPVVTYSLAQAVACQ